MTDPAEKPSAGTVCYIDDEVNLLSVVRRGLERRSWAVDTISDPFDALRRVRKANPRIVILDLLMPGMDGYQVLRALKSSSDLGHIPVVIASARDAQKDKEMAFSMGAAAFLVKPFGVKELLLTIESVLGPTLPPPDAPESAGSPDASRPQGG